MDEFKEFENNNETNPTEAQPETNSWEPETEMETSEPAVTPEFVSAPSTNSAGSNGMAIASMVLGIIALVFGCCLWYISIPCSIVGLILGGVSLAQKRGGKGMAIAGIVLSAIGIIVAIIVLVALGGAIMSGALDGMF